MGKPDTEIGVNKSENRFSGIPAHQTAKSAIAIIASCQSIAVNQMKTLSIDINGDRIARRFDADLFPQEFPHMTVVITADVEYSQSLLFQIVQFGENWESTRRNAVSPLEPKIEQVADDKQRICLSRFGTEKFQDDRNTILACVTRN